MMHTPYDEEISKLETAIRTMEPGNDSLLREASDNLHDKANQRHGYRLGVAAITSQRDQLRDALELLITSLKNRDNVSFPHAEAALKAARGEEL